MKRYGLPINYTPCLAAVLWLALLAVGIELLTPSPGAAQLATYSDQPLAAYFVTWHATARGSAQMEYGNNNSIPDKHVAAMSGTAIVRCVARRSDDRGRL